MSLPAFFQLALPGGCCPVCAMKSPWTFVKARAELSCSQQQTAATLKASHAFVSDDVPWNWRDDGHDWPCVVFVVFWPLGWFPEFIRVTSPERIVENMPGGGNVCQATAEASLMFRIAYDIGEITDRKAPT